MTLQEIQHKAQSIIHKWRDDDSAPYIEFVDELAHMIVPEPSADLEEAAWDCVLDSVDVNNPVLLPKYKELLTYLFIAGAEWQKEQMMKEAIGGNAYPNDGEIWVDLARYGYKFKEGEPCRIIIVKE